VGLGCEPPKLQSRNESPWKIKKVRAIFDGNANTMLFSAQNIEATNYLGCYEKFGVKN